MAGLHIAFYSCNLGRVWLVFSFASLLMEGVWFFHFIVGGDDSGVKSKVSLCQIYGAGVPVPPVYLIATKLWAQQLSRGRPARAKAID